MKDIELGIMNLIANGGSARSLAMKAIYAAKKGSFDEADKDIQKANDYLLQAHHVQTKFLTEEAQGKNHQVSLLMVHAQDHLMNAITVRDLAKEIIDIYRKDKNHD
ncbi:PTS lactose/cellobiose transporter subunit IIA [Lactobacillus mulieris]|uniref:PTS lactose/cellobiose transporter subunit IIA n=1 Tax=Lactobacillus mulieris TaxID=2508708 RepID=UPI001432D686|nr:PTS lactose/cellobiose transporter subunit IIA [Lactobacillus mulieris]MCF1783646.1 PTS lactose/cellobiose transporter subunit IIA [Lactobacillus mulieris]MCW8104266.1 PTS lactose/cellobiose transporter subunit IIA [Lactobacillus mulieris]MDK6803126.1 PTS lactose/cellobiose transporter subunit IIA [Lactobacillus mulieris]MDK8382242.1 PTS lactose/cellobiose transporter subunit IIA [Lactobacillus mulieris]MDT9620384.1 PTS lactose/cellobiose transporter subunit IIA [Lactobacillus mulieris]